MRGIVRFTMALAVALPGCGGAPEQAATHETSTSATPGGEQPAAEPEAGAQAPAQAPDALASGEAALAAGDLDSAERSFREAMAQGHELPGRLGLVGVLLARIRDRGVAEAQALLDEAQELLDLGLPASEVGTAEQAEEEARLRAEVTELEARAPASTASSRTGPSRGAGVGRGHAVGGLRGRGSALPSVRNEARRSSGTLEPDAIQEVIRSHAREIRFCYQRELANRPDLQGHVTIEGFVAPNGRVARASIESSNVPDANVQRCILGAFRRWRFPAAREETRIVHPFVLSNRR